MNRVKKVLNKALDILAAGNTTKSVKPKSDPFTAATPEREFRFSNVRSSYFSRNEPSNASADTADWMSANAVPNQPPALQLC